MAGLRKSVPVAPEFPINPADVKQRAVAFVNWAIPMQDGTFLKASKGFPIFQNPQYPNKHEDMLVALAEQHGGMVELNLRCRVSLNNSVDPTTIDLNTVKIDVPDIPVTPGIAG